MAAIEKACKEGKKVIAMGDFNCDREMKNDPLKRGDVKAVTEILAETMSKSGLYQMTYKTCKKMFKWFPIHHTHKCSQQA